MEDNEYLKEMENRPNILVIPGDDHYVNNWGQYLDGIKYNIDSVFEQWDWESPLARGTHGPLNSDFIKNLIEDKDTKDYQAIIVDQFCSDLIPIIKESKYKGKIVAVSTKGPLDGADYQVDTLSEMGFENKLNSVIKEICEK